MEVRVADIFKKIDELDTYLIIAGWERMNDIELVCYFRNSSEEDQKATLIIAEPNYKKRDFEDD